MSSETGFDWDPLKAARNQMKHGVGFPEASTAFEDPRSLTGADTLHSSNEERFVLVGRSVEGRLLVVIHVDRGETIRIISARRATWHERVDYEQAQGNR